MKIKNMTLNFCSKHPAAHGVLRVVIEFKDNLRKPVMYVQKRHFGSSNIKNGRLTRFFKFRDVCNYKFSKVFMRYYVQMGSMTKKNWNPIRYLFCWRLSPKQKVEFDINLEKFEQDIKIYRKAELRYWFFFRAFCSVNLFGNVLFWSELFSFSVYFGPVYFVGALFSATYIYHKEKVFIKNYDQKNCNPSRLITSWMSLKSNSAYTTIVGSLTIGGLVGIDSVYERLIGESALTQFGKWIGVHKDSPIRKIKNNSKF